MKTQSLDFSLELYTDDEYYFENENQDGYLTIPTDYPFWESQVYYKSYFKRNDKKFRYFDSSSIFSFLFFTWVRRWTKYVSKDYIHPYKLHPLPVSDQILYWQPIFSKHVSDGLVRLENYETNKFNLTTEHKNVTPYKSVLLRALWLTFWKRLLISLIGVIISNMFSMSISIFVYYFFKRIDKGPFNFFQFVGFVVGTAVLQFIDGFILDHLTFYIYRLVYIIQYSFSLTIFQHGLCHRRKYYNNVEGSNALNVCNNVLHSCSPDSECSKNPLFCPARRYQNKDISPKIFSFEFIDSYYISLFIESLLSVIQFIINCVYGFLLVEFFMDLPASEMVLATIAFVLAILLIEGFNTFILNYIYTFKDYRISQCRDVICSYYIIVKMSLDSIVHNIITETRNTELSLILVRLLMSFANKIFFTLTVSLMFLFVLSDFVDQLKRATRLSHINSTGLLTLLYVLLKIIYSISHFPNAIKQIFSSIASFGRIKKYINNCSPNYYISDNMFKGSVNMSCKVSDVTKEVGNNVVLYKDASFAWIHSRKEFVEGNYHKYLKNINFELKRGEVAIITGSQGSGKSNFIKSVLGEMTLVGGSMAVVPLHTSMPIFYASQDIWLKKGTIRSNILFGYKFDQEIYDIVVKTVELKSDISTWEYGDMRVVYDNGYCLSGGQRVRMELARALYAYMVFSQVNKQYNEGKCSLLMCLDSPFSGLDPFVSKTVFNNFFNAASGLLIKSDLSVILSTSKRSLDICVGSSDLKKFPNIPVYQMSDMTMFLYRNLHSYLDTTHPDTDAKLDVPHNSESGLAMSSPNSLVSGFSSLEMNNKCIDWSGIVTRHKSTVNQYERPECSNSLSSTSGFKPYITYLSASSVTFSFFILLMFAVTIMDNLKFVFAGDLSDYIRDKVDGAKTIEDVVKRFSDVKKYSDKCLKKVSIFTVCIVLVCLTATVFLAISCIVSSRKIHEYCIGAIFKYSSSVIKIKKQISHLITYLTADIFQIDESLGYAMSVALVSVVESLIHFLSICFLLPSSIPVIVIVVFIIVKFVFIRYVNASKNLQIASLESTSQINAICENAISGSSIYRSFKKEGEYMANIIEHTDYYMRCLFMNKAILAKSTIICKCWFLFMNSILITPLVMLEYFKVKLNPGMYGLAISLAMIVSCTFTNFMLSFARLEVLMCSMKRFENFVPPGTKCRFFKKKNTREEELIVKYSEAVMSDEQDDMAKNQLYKRREAEYFKDATCCKPVSKMFKKPKIVKLDVSKYIQPRHFAVQIKNLYVSTSDSKAVKYILKQISSSASASNIIGIIGRTGSGKTTLLSVIQNTCKNRTGQVLLDGKDLNDIPKNLLTQVVGVLPQLPFVFKGWTVRRFLDPRKLFSDDEINEALDNCGLLDFVNNLPGFQRLDTVIIQEDFKFITKRKKKEIPKVNNRMSKYRKSLTVADLKNYYADSDMILSSSQLRTLSFARLILYRKFYRVILVDEPPSENCDDENADFVTQDVGIPIYELLQKYFSHCTTFVTAHDANALKLCTSVWVMHDGELIRTCTRDEIMVNESISNIIEESVRRKK